MLDLIEAPLVEGQVSRILSSLRDLHWEASMIEFHMGGFRENLSVHKWENHLVKNIKLRQVLLLEVHIGRFLGEKLRSLQWYLTRLQGSIWLK